MKRRWEVCIDPDVESEVIEADILWYAQETGWLTFQNRSEAREGNKHIAVFAPGKWVYFKEITDEPR